VSFYFHWIWPWIWKIRSRFAGKNLALDQPLPDFKLSDLGGRAHRLSDVFPKKGAVLWLTNLCEECEKKIPFLEELRQQQGNKWEILAVSILGNDRRKPLEIQSKHGFGFPLLLDPEDWVAKVLGLEHPADACPLFNLLVLNSKGLLRFRVNLSAISEDKLRQVLTVEGK